ncbi:MAG: TIM-barrel domain-containing protein, partial [Desulfosalsimonas sp.]
MSTPSAALNQLIGNYRSHDQTQTGIIVTAENALLEIMVCTETTIRVNARGLDQERADSSYAVNTGPEQTDWRLEPRETRLLIHTRRLIVQIDLYPVRVSFYTPEGGLINADDPAFGISWLGETVTAYKTLQSYERFIGLGEKTGNLDRRSSAYVNWNTDYFGYPPFADPLYASIPFYIGIHSGLIYGIYLDNTHLTRFNFGAANNRFAAFSADAGPMDYYFFHGASVAEVISAYTALTGRMPLPPIWSLGYQQCRYSYFPDTEVLRVARTFREKHIPADVIYLDIHYMDDFKVFTWDPERFADPAGLVEKLKELEFHTAAIVDPGIKIEEGYEPYADGLEKDVFVKYPDGQPYAGEVWPGWCHFPDFTNPKTRTWWGKWLKTLTDAGVEGIWCDMNEPAAWGHQVPDLIEFDHDGRQCTHKKARNIYGMQMARASYEAAQKQLSGRRPFVLTRAGFSGVQRYAAMWTGDNIADDDHMLAAVRLVNSMGVSGLGFCGCDIPGFAGEATPALFAR